MGSDAVLGRCLFRCCSTGEGYYRHGPGTRRNDGKVSRIFIGLINNVASLYTLHSEVGGIYSDWGVCFLPVHPYVLSSFNPTFVSATASEPFNRVL